MHPQTSNMANSRLDLLAIVASVYTVKHYDVNYAYTVNTVKPY